MSIGIYKIENLINGKVYIGQSVHIEKRWAEHCRPSSNSLVGEAIKKYGKENFSFQILEITTQEDLNNRESFFIKQYNSLVPNGYNMKYEDNKEHHQFNNYTYNDFLDLIHDIKYSNLSFQEIADEYGIDLSMIYYINRGDYHTLPNETYPLREVKDFSKKIHYCIECGAEVSKQGVRCVKCSAFSQRKAERPDRDLLKQLIRTKTFVSIGKEYGVTDNTIRKWCKGYKLPYQVKVIKQFSEEEWAKL